MALPTNTAAPTTHILKPEPARFPGLVDNDAFCMILTSACIVSTVFYGELTTRLAMSIGGARQLDEVDAGAWAALAGQAGFRPAFVTRTVDDLLDRAAVESAALVRMPAHSNDTASLINARIQSLAEPA